MDPIQTIALALGASWASGLNLYAAILALGAMHNLGHLELPPQLHVLGDPLVLIAAALMYAIEFVADKIPGVDSGWDALHTFIRIPAGAVLAAQALGPLDPALSLAAGLLGGTMAGMSHATKASGRLLINTSPEPFSNWTASIAEDAAVLAGLWAAVNHPAVFLGALAGFTALVIWLLPKGVRLLGRVASRIGALVRGRPHRSPPAPQPTAGPEPGAAPPRAVAVSSARLRAPQRAQAPRERGRGYRGGPPRA